MRFGILQRYVSGEVFRSFAMALLTITIVFVLFIVMTEATHWGLSPREIFWLVPFVIPGSLPYTVPVSLLFAVTVVYGRLAGDNEVIAVKTAGLSVGTVLWPSLSLGVVLSVVLMWASGGPIPDANRASMSVIFNSADDMFYKFLKKDRETFRGDWPFKIKVKDVEGHELIGATIKHRVARADPNRPAPPPKPGESDEPAMYDQVIQAKRARITFDVANGVAHVYLDGADVQQSENFSLINDSQFDLPLPPDFMKTPPPQIKEMTDSHMVAEQRSFVEKMANERKRQTCAAALWIASGHPERVNWKEFQAAFGDYEYWRQRWQEYETERRMRGAMAWGSFFFVLLGAPVGIRFARRDFLSAFITCFVPIILVYYPLMLGGANLGRGGFVNPILALWLGNFVLLVLTGLVFRPVYRH